MFAVIETGGKQYIVSVGDTLSIEKVPGAGASVDFDKVLLVKNEKGTIIGTPYVNGSVVSAKVLGEKREGKKIVFRFHSKTRYRKTKSHRQTHTVVTITNIA